MNDQPKDVHPPEAGEDAKLRFDDPEVQRRHKTQAANFEYGLMSMDDVDLTLETDDPEQDERDIAGIWAVMRGKEPR